MDLLTKAQQSLVAMQDAGVDATAIENQESIVTQLDMAYQEALAGNGTLSEKQEYNSKMSIEEDKAVVAILQAHLDEVNIILESK